MGDSFVLGFRPSIGRNQFFADYYELQPLLCERCFPPPSPDAIWRIIDSTLRTHDCRREMLKIINTTRIEPASYLREYVDIGITRVAILKERLYEHLREGATMVMNRVDISSSAFSDICVDVGQFLGLQTTGNLYACLGGGPATGLHWDTHDVFVVQLTGRKSWNIFPPTFELPLSGQESAAHKQTVTGPPVLSHVLEAGDALYVPRGWWHQVEPVAGHETVHLTVAIHAPTVLDYLIWACGNVVTKDVQFRRSIVGRSCEEKNIEDALKLLAATLSDAAIKGRFAERVRTKDIVQTNFNVRRAVVGRLEEIDDSTRFRIASRVTAPVDDSVITKTKQRLEGIDAAVLAAIAHFGQASLATVCQEMGNVDRSMLRARIFELFLKDMIEPI